ncbi:MAG TPA: hypothetical protein PKA51_10145 [Kiritimatiellia bacterium]|nr:hypothetical protein [Kiritimatiellia bacterium]
MKPGYLRFLICGFCAILAGHYTATAQTPPEHMEAYVLLIKAEQEEQAGREVEALGLYRQAAERYQEVARQYPHWQPDVVRYRLAHTQNQITRLERKTPADPAAPSEGPSTPAATPPPALPDPLLEEKLEQFREEKSLLELAIEELENERAVLLEKNAGWEKEKATWERKLAAAEKRQAAADTSKKQMEAELEARQQQVQALEADKEQLAARGAEVDALLERAAQELRSHQEQRQVDMERNQREREAWESERAVWEQDRQALAAAMRDLESTRELQATHERLTGAWESLKEQAAALSNHIARLEVAARDAQQAAQAERKEWTAEQKRLNAEIHALKQTVDSQQGELVRVRDLRATIRALEKDKKDLGREIEALNRAITTARQNDEAVRLRAQNAVLLEELRVFRAHVAGLEQRIRESERERVLNPATP